MNTQKHSEFRQWLKDTEFAELKRCKKGSELLKFIGDAIDKFDELKESGVKESYFPITIRISDTNEIKTIENPESLPSGVAFVVLETNEKSEPKLKFELIGKKVKVTNRNNVSGLAEFYGNKWVISHFINGNFSIDEYKDAISQLTKNYTPVASMV